jgi:hypothetical protein
MLFLKRWFIYSHAIPDNGEAAWRLGVSPSSLPANYAGRLIRTSLAWYHTVFSLNITFYPPYFTLNQQCRAACRQRAQQPSFPKDTARPRSAQDRRFAGQKANDHFESHDNKKPALFSNGF